MTVLEQRFMESVPITLRNIADELHGINENLRDIKKSLDDTSDTNNA